MMPSEFSPAMSDNARRASNIRSAMTLIELLIVIVVASVLLVIVFWCFRVERVSRLRKGCANNLKAIGTAMYLYSSPSSDDWPIAPHVPAVEVGIGQVSYAPKMIGLNRNKGRDSDFERISEDAQLSTTRNLWMLIRIGASDPKSFICPESNDSPNMDANPKVYWDFKSWNEVSYGYQVPYGMNGKPTSDRDQRMILAADKGPYGAALENGQPHPGIPDQSAAATPDKWRRWNSPNHGGEGQVVLFADSHVEFVTKPTAGIKNDNIYTRWSGAEGFIEANEWARAWGTPPTSNETPFSNTDSLIYP